MARSVIEYVYVNTGTPIRRILEFLITRDGDISDIPQEMVGSFADYYDSARDEAMEADVENFLKVEDIETVRDAYYNILTGLYRDLQSGRDIPNDFR